MMQSEQARPLDLAAISSRARAIVTELSKRFPSRNGMNPSALHGAAEFVEEEFRGYTVESQEYETHGVPVRNIAVVKRGLDSSKPCIVLGAHYDSVVGTPGADDNASGVAGLLELARLLKDYPNGRTIHFVAFTHEEPPYFYSAQMGSRQYARRLKKDGVQVQLMLSLEMIGYAGETMEQQYPFVFLRQLGGYPMYGNFIGLVSNLRSMRLLKVVRGAMRSGCSVGVESLAAPGFLPPLFLSDHSSFWKHGFPALMVTDTAFLRNPHYHLPGDTAETLNYDFLAEVVKGVYEVVMVLDKLDQ
ncbi:MAG: M28 family peptidase [Bacteroidota bacterium]